MASGMGKRFGGNKLMANFCGEPMILRALRATQDLFARRVVITRHEDVAALCRTLGIEAVLHTLPHRSDTVRLGLEAMQDMDACLFCPGDQPLLRRETVSALIRMAEVSPNAICRTAFGETPGAPICFPRWAFAELMSLPEGKGGGYLTKKYPERVLMLPVGDEAELMDVDTPEDLAFLAARQE